jgi:DNA-binding HxlR family transcriptional regulator
MARTRFTAMNCPAARALDEIGDWWTLLIVREALYGTSSFSGFQDKLGIARNILTDRLNALVENGVLERRQTKPETERYAYVLTDKGRDLLPILVALMQWADRWVFGRGAEPLRVLDARTRSPIEQIVVSSRDGRKLSINDLRFRPGPGADQTTLARFAAARAMRSKPDKN